MSTELSDWLINRCKFAPELSENIYNQLIENGIFTSNDLKLINEEAPTWIDAIEIPKLTKTIIQLHIKKIGRLELITLKPKDVENLMSKLYNGDYVEAMKTKLISGLELCCIDHIDTLHQYGITSGIHALSLLTFIKEWKKYGIPMSLIYHSDIIYKSGHNNDVAISSSSSVLAHPQPHIAATTETVATKISNNEGGNYCYNLNDERPDFHSHKHYPLNHINIPDHNHSVFTISPLDDDVMDHHLDLGMDLNEYDDMNYDNDYLLNETFHEHNKYYRYDVDNDDNDDDRTATGSTCSDSSLEQIPKHSSLTLATSSQRKRVGGRVIIVGDNTSNIIPRTDDYIMTNNNQYNYNRAKLNMRPPKRSNTTTNSNTNINNITQRSTRTSSNMLINSPTGYNTRKYAQQSKNPRPPLKDTAISSICGGGYNTRKRKIQCNNSDRNNNTTTNNNSSNNSSSNKNNSSSNKNNTSTTTVSDKCPRKGQPKYIFHEACEIIKSSNDIKVLNSVLKNIIYNINPPSSSSYIKQSSNKKNKQTMAINDSSTNNMNNDHEDNVVVNVRDVSRDNIDVLVNTKTFLKLFQIIHKHASYDDPVSNYCILFVMLI